jgi:uncharacterized membrane protein
VTAILHFALAVVDVVLMVVLMVLTIRIGWLQRQISKSQKVMNALFHARISDLEEASVIARLAEARREAAADVSPAKAVN